jgi:hypothetical protein
MLPSSDPIRLAAEEISKNNVPAKYSSTRSYSLQILKSYKDKFNCSFVYSPAYPLISQAVRLSAICLPFRLLKSESFHNLFYLEKVPYVALSVKPQPYILSDPPHIARLRLSLRLFPHAPLLHRHFSSNSSNLLCPFCSDLSYPSSVHLLTSCSRFTQHYNDLAQDINSDSLRILPCILGSNDEGELKSSRYHFLAHLLAAFSQLKRSDLTTSPTSS